MRTAKLAFCPRQNSRAHDHKQSIRSGTRAPTIPPRGVTEWSIDTGMKGIAKSAVCFNQPIAILGCAHTAHESDPCWACPDAVSRARLNQVLKSRSLDIM